MLDSLPVSVSQPMTRKPTYNPLTFRLNEVDRAALQAVADQRGLSRSALIRQGLIQIGVPLQAAAGQQQQAA
jgi:hypothetical protein